MPATLDQAATLRAMAAGRRPAAAAACTRCHGDTGARTVWENLGIALAASGHRTLLLPLAYGSFWRREAAAEEAEAPGIGDHYGLFRAEAPVPAAAGGRGLADLLSGRHALAGGMEVLLLECGYGSSSRARDILPLAPTMLLVFTCDAHSVLASYELVKRVARARLEAGLPEQRLLLLANKAPSPEAGREALKRFCGTAGNFLGLRPAPIGALPFDARVGEARAAGLPVSVLFPDCGFSKSAAAAAENLMEELCRTR